MTKVRIAFARTDTGLLIGNLTWDFCTRMSDGAVVSTTGATLTELGLGNYILNNPNITALTAFSVHVTADPTKYYQGEFDPRIDNLPANLIGNINTGVLQNTITISATEPLRAYRGDYLPSGTITFNFGSAWDCSGGKKIYFCVKKATDAREIIDVETTLTDAANATGTVPNLDLESYGITAGNYVYDFERRDGDGTKPRTIMRGIFVIENDTRKS